MADGKEDVLIYKQLAIGVLQQAAHDLELQPGDPHRDSAERFLRSSRRGYKEIRTIWCMIAFLQEE